MRLSRVFEAAQAWVDAHGAIYISALIVVLVVVLYFAWRDSE